MSPPDLREHSLSLTAIHSIAAHGSPLLTPTATTPSYHLPPPLALTTADPHLLQSQAAYTALLSNIPYIDHTIDATDLINGVATIIEALFPAWNVSTDCELVQCTNGITNKLVRCRRKSSGECVLVRVYGRGSSVLIDRDQELMNMVTLAQQGLSPPLHGRFVNGIVYGYTEGTVFSVADMSDPHKSILVAKHLAKWHTVQLPLAREPKLFPILWKWLDTVPKTYSNPLNVQRFNESGISLDRIRSDLAALEQHLEPLASPIVFCHCDLLSGNIIYTSTSTTSTSTTAETTTTETASSSETSNSDSVNFIDYEYGCYSYRGFDIANHFCEWAGFDCDWKLYPTADRQYRWIEAYLSESRRIQHSITQSQSQSQSQSLSSRTLQPPTQTEIHALHREVLKFSLVAHLFWTVWALVQTEISDLDFDYLGYAQQRLDEFYRRKDEWMRA
eukprot:jgi/Hompol1/2269/HPOL_002874-RA